MTMSVDDLDQWVATARPGTRVCYAAGAALPAKIGAFAMALCEDGVITLACGGTPGDRRWYAYRISAPVRATAAVAPAAVPPVMAAVLGEFGRAAAAGRVCPSNREVADRLGLDGARPVAERLAALVKRRLVQVEGVAGGRIVTIVSTGQRTAVPA